MSSTPSLVTDTSRLRAARGAMPTRWRIPRVRIYGDRPRSRNRFCRIRAAADRTARDHHRAGKVTRKMPADFVIRRPESESFGRIRHPPRDHVTGPVTDPPAAVRRRRSGRGGLTAHRGSLLPAGVSRSCRLPGFFACFPLTVRVYFCPSGRIPAPAVPFLPSCPEGRGRPAGFQGRIQGTPRPPMGRAQGRGVLEAWPGTKDIASGALRAARKER